jgi:hypothetical protein
MLYYKSKSDDHNTSSFFFDEIKNYYTRYPAKILPTYMLDIQKTKKSDPKTGNLAKRRTRSKISFSSLEKPSKNFSNSKKPLNRSTSTEKKILKKKNKNKLNRIITVVSRHALVCKAFKSDLSKEKISINTIK